MKKERTRTFWILWQTLLNEPRISQTCGPINAKSKTNINVNTLSLFRGGKGPGLTSEIGIDYVMGTKNDKATSLSESPKLKNSSRNYLAYVGLGVTKNVGLSYGHAGYSSKFTLDDNFSGQLPQQDTA